MLFAVSTVVLLLFAFLSRLIGPSGVFVDFHFLRRGYGFSPDSVCVFMASFLCVFAAIYSVFVFPLNQKAALWHFWLTAIGILLFWVVFYSFSALPPGGLRENSAPLWMIAIGGLTSLALVIVAQGVFVTNLVSGIVRLCHHS